MQVHIGRRQVVGYVKELYNPRKLKITCSGMEEVQLLNLHWMAMVVRYNIYAHDSILAWYSAQL